MFKPVANADYLLQTYPQSTIKQTLLPRSNPETTPLQTGVLLSVYLPDTVQDVVSATGQMQNSEILNI